MLFLKIKIYWHFCNHEIFKFNLWYLTKFTKICFWKPLQSNFCCAVFPLSVNPSIALWYDFIPIARCVAAHRQADLLFINKQQHKQLCECLPPASLPAMTSRQPDRVRQASRLGPHYVATSFLTQLMVRKANTIRKLFKSYATLS